MPFHGLEEVLRAGGLVAAAGTRPAKALQNGRNPFLVEPNEDAKKPRHGLAGGRIVDAPDPEAGGTERRRPARRASFCHSARRAANSAFTAG